MTQALAIVPVGLIGNCECRLPCACVSTPYSGAAISKFDDPDQEERTLYAQYWQKKLKKNKAVSFPDELVANIAQATDGFSFAYLKEALYVLHVYVTLYLN